MPYWVSAVFRTSIRRTEFVAIFGLAVVAGVLRFARLDYQSLWLDEAYTIYYATNQSWVEIVHNFIEAGENGPVYTFLMRVWIEIGNRSGTWLRTFSAIFGILTVPAAFYFYRQFLTRRVSLIASAFVVLSPMYVWYSQEGRQYSLITFVSVCSFAICAGLIRAESQKRLTWLGIANSIILLVGMLIHLFAIWLVVIEAVLVAAAWPVRRRNALYWIASAALPSALLIGQNFTMLGPASVFGYAEPGVLELMGTTLHVILSNGRLPADAVLGVASFLVASALLIPRQFRDSPNAFIRPSRAAGFLLFAVAAPLVTYYVFSLVVSPVSLPRYFAYLGIPLFGLMALGVDVLYSRVRLLGLAAAALVVASFTAIVIHSYFVPAKAEFRSAIQEIVADSSGDELIIVRPSVMIAPVLHYSTELSPNGEMRLRPHDGVPEDDLLAEMRSTHEFWIVDVLTVGFEYPDDLDEVAVDVAGHITEVREYFGLRVARLASGR